MKILSLELYNFRQYYGKQKITFADDTYQNTTIIFGENGKGKTGIYRALMFALFSTRHIPQDNENDEVHLVNFLHIEKNSPAIAEAYVTVEFEHEGEYYILQRKVMATRINQGRINERLGSSELQFKDTNGNVKPKTYTDDEEIRKIVNTVLDEEIKDFFLFDAEKIDTLTKDDTDIRKQVKDAILNLLQMNNIEQAQEIIKREKALIEDKLRDDISDQKLNSLEFQKQNIQKDIRSKQELLEVYESEIGESDRTISEHNVTLNKNKEILEINKKIKENKDEILEHKNRLDYLNNEIAQTHFKIAPYLILQKTLASNAKDIENFLGEEKIKVPVEIVEESLNKGNCMVCSTDLNENSENIKYLEALLESHSHSETYEFARTLLYMFEHRKDEFTDEEERLSYTLREYNETLAKIDKLKEDNEQYEKQVSQHAKLDIDLASIEEMIQKAKQSKEDNKFKSKKATEDIDSLEKTEEQVINVLNEMYETQSRNINEKKKFELLKNLEKNLKNISKEFNDEMRELLGNETTNIFRTLIDKKDIDLIEKVEINGKFEIKAIDHKGVSILSDISQGQRQILSLAFITALARIAVKKTDSNMIDYPLFMDSPFNRLSGNNRDHLINHLPDLTAQWILLLTDTEYTSSEEFVFKESGRLGKSYIINQVELNHSIIEEVDLDESLATRGGL